MNYKKIDNTYVLKLDKGEEILMSLKCFCEKEKILTASLSGIGATGHLETFFFDSLEKRYHTKIYEEDLEILSLNGNITSFNNEPYIHLHVIASDSQGRALGGHLNKAIVSVTCEIFIQKLDVVIERYKDEEFNVNFMKFKEN